jgi:hypothetical protein
VVPVLTGTHEHAVACHFPLNMTTTAQHSQPALTPSRLRLQRLQSAFQTKVKTEAD